MDILKNTLLLEIPLINWVIAIIVLVVVYGLLELLKSTILRRLEKRSGARQDAQLDQFIVSEVRSIRGYFLFAVALYLATVTLVLPARPQELIRLLIVTAVLLQVAVWGQGLIGYLINRRMQERLQSDPAAATTLNVFNLIARVVLWAVIILLVLDNLPGIQIDSLVASLGITGVAVALAVQNILGDLFASLSIALDKPFMIGDFIIIDNYMGTVEHIGLKSTRVRSLEGEQLIVSNSDMLGSRIRNFKRMNRRRVQFSLRVRHGTPADKLEAIPMLVREIVTSHLNVTFDRAHFKEIGETALVFEVVYFVEVPDYNVYMDIQQQINLELTKRFAEKEIQFAIPTQMIALDPANGKVLQ